MDTSKFEGYKNTLKQNYIGNECESDEYRETQPYKGMGHINQALQYLKEEQTTEWKKRINNETEHPHDGDYGQIDKETEQLTSLTRDWLQAWSWGYSGSAELALALEMVFDILWRHGKHPYYDTEEDLLKATQDIQDEMNSLSDSTDIP